MIKKTYIFGNLRAVIFSLICLMFYTTVQAQFEEPFLKHISVDEGLSQSSVYCIFQDHKGFLWLGTGDGLNKYDGYEITVYRHRESDTNSLADNAVRAITEDPNGNIWIATSEGLNKYNVQNGKFTTYSITWVEALYTDRAGKIWVGTNNGVYVIYPGSDSIHRYQYPANYEITNEHVLVKSIIQDMEGNIWLCTGEDIDKIDHTTGMLECYKWHLHEINLTKKALSFSMIEQNPHTFWIATQGNGILKLNSLTGKIKQIYLNSNPSASIEDNSVNAIQIINDSTLIIGTSEDGIFTFNTKTETFKQLFNHELQPNFFRTNNTRCFFRDKSGIFWIGTDGDGVYKYNPYPRKFKHLSANNGTLSGNFIRAIYEDSKHRTWIGTYEHGITVWDKKLNTFKHYLNDILQNNQASKAKSINGICADTTGTIWLGADDGLRKFDEKSERFIKVIPKERVYTEKVTAIANSSTGLLWIAFNSQLFSFNPYTGGFEDMQFTQKNFPGAKSMSITCMYEDSQRNLWIGTYDGGANKINFQTRECTTLLYNKKNINGISHDMVKSFYQSNDGAIWICTEHGLNKIDSQTGMIRRFFEEDGLPSAFIYGILEDNHGELWLSTNKGISRFNTVTNTFRNYGTEDGLQSNEFNSGAFFKNRDGEMYFGGINGLNIFFPDSILDNPSVPQIVLTGFKKVDLPATIQGEASELTDITMEYKDDIFSLRFAALEYSNPQKNQYAYMLEGFEPDWIYCGTKREVRYTHLDPGTYIFHVKGSNNDGVWNNQGIAISITIIPPFWRTWWFLSITGILLIGTLFAGIRTFERGKMQKHLAELERERAMERERARISQDMHDEVGANLTKIAIMSEIALRDLDNKEAIEQRLQKISSDARDVVDGIGEIVWAINPKNDRLGNLISFTREYAAGFFEGTDIACHFQIPENLPEYPLSGENRRNILLVVKEGLNNIMKHSGANEVNIKFSIEHDLLSIIIHDNGKGFSPESISEWSNGISNMKRRMESIKGFFEIHSVKQQGTTLTIQLELKKQDFRPR